MLTLTFAAVMSCTMAEPPLEETVAVTSAGVVTVNATSQPESAHAGSAGVRCPPDTVCVIAGHIVAGSSLAEPCMSRSVTWTRLTSSDRTCTGAPWLSTVIPVITCGIVTVRLATFFRNAMFTFAGVPARLMSEARGTPPIQRDAPSG